MDGMQQYWEKEKLLIVVTCKENLCECSQNRQNHQRFFSTTPVLKIRGLCNSPQLRLPCRAPGGAGMMVQQASAHTV